jgi:hypothetical protein
MRRAALAVYAAVFAITAHAEDNPAPGWEFNASGYWNVPRGEDAFATGVFIAKRGALHLEARANYEAVHAQSAFVGWNFSWGKEVTLEATPIVGGVTGTARGPIVGIEATVSAGKFDWYIEAEHVRDRVDGHFNYAWTELGYRPVEWLRLGLVGQHTRVYGSDRTVERGPFVQVTYGKVTLGGYWFNPGASDQVAVAMLAVGF